jgi:hypothetical protein
MQFCFLEYNAEIRHIFSKYKEPETAPTTILNTKVIIIAHVSNTIRWKNWAKFPVGIGNWHIGHNVLRNNIFKVIVA